MTYHTSRDVLAKICASQALDSTVNANEYVLRFQ